MNAFDVLMAKAGASAVSVHISGNKRARDSSNFVSDLPVGSLADNEEIDLVSVTESEEEDATKLVPAAELFAPLFRKVAATKHITAVRHAKTKGYNIIDTPLGKEGRLSAPQVATRVPKHVLDNVEVFVVSPLTRALQTALLAFSPHIDCGKHEDVRFCGGGRPILVTPLARERRSTRGDIGRSGAELALQPEFSRIQHKLVELTPYWWRDAHEAKAKDSGKPGVKGTALGAGRVTGVPPCFDLPEEENSETTAHFKQRIHDFRAYLRALPYNNIVLVSHAKFLGELMGSSAWMDYCEVRHFKL